MATIAGASVLKPVLRALLVGATKMHHLAEAVAALYVRLTENEITALQVHDTPHEPHLFLIDSRHGRWSY